MTNIKNSVLSFLLAIATVCTLLPVSAFAVELTGEHICDEDCNEYTDFLLMNEDEITEDIITVETSEASADIYSGTIEESNIQWSVNPDTGMMLFTGEGDCPTFNSAEDQPWKHLRSLIREVWFFTMDDITAESLAHWFEGCTVLERAEIPYNTLNIGENTFASCPSLRLLMLYYSDTAPVITEGAFYTDTLTPLEIALIPGTPAAEDIYEYDWTGENRAVYFSDIYGIMLLASGYCLNCNGSYSYTLDYEQWTSSEHCVRHWCSRCGKDQLEGVGGEDHTMSNGTCTKCGYSDGTGSGGGSGGGGGDSGGGDETCYHYSTYKSWIGCDWYEYCYRCGKLMDYGTSHGSTYTEWSGCYWEDYCNDCGKLVNYGTSHSNVSYGAWEYYSSTQHRRYGTCSRCGYGSYSYGRHSTTTKYTSYSAAQHQRGSYCSACGSYVGTTTKSNHSFTYDTWTSYNDTQHRRRKYCATCGYSEYEYANHSLSYSGWTTTDDGHSRTLSCSCGYTATEADNHSFTCGSWTEYDDIQHRRTKTCSICGYSGYEYDNHSPVSGEWTSMSDTQHRRINTCSCGYSQDEIGDHTDTDNNGYCDVCSHLMSHFSVTVPAKLSLTASKDGEVYAATLAQIVNNSTSAVRVSDITLTAENGWNIVPYVTNMAKAKVNTKLIGFRLNDAESAENGRYENLSIGSGWTVAKDGALSLNYDAVVSAISQPVDEQVLTIVFVIGWAV